MPIDSRQKGKRGELELATRLRELGFDARRSVQYNGKAGAADLVGIPGVHIECKRVEKLNLNEAVEQARRDAKDGDIPTVFHRKNGKEWLVTMRLLDWSERFKDM